jgi:hypothetical protein
LEWKHIEIRRGTSGRFWGWALFPQVLLPTSAYFYTRDSTSFYTGDAGQCIMPW